MWLGASLPSPRCPHPRAPPLFCSWPAQSRNVCGGIPERPFDGNGRVGADSSTISSEATDLGPAGCEVDANSGVHLTPLSLSAGSVRGDVGPVGRLPTEGEEPIRGGGFDGGSIQDAHRNRHAYTGLMFGPSPTKARILFSKPSRSSFTVSQTTW